MLIKRMWVHAMLGLVLGLTATTVQGSPVEREQVRKLMALSGLRDQTLAAEPWVRQSVAELRANKDLPHRNREIAAQVIEGAFDGQALVARIEDNLARAWDAQRMEAVLEFLQSPLGRAITAMEVASSDVSTQPDEQRWRAQLGDNPPDQQRVAMLVELDQVSGASSISIEMWTILSSTSALAAAAAGPSEVSLTPEVVQRVRNAVREQIAQPIQQSVLVSMLYTYRNASEQQLQDYIAFHRSPTGQWYRDVVAQALLQAIATTAQDAREQIRAMVAL